MYNLHIHAKGVVDKNTNDPSPGSGWWHTIYPDWLEEENKTLVTLLETPEIIP